MYGPEVNQPGKYAYNCLMARRLAERGVRFTQVFLRGWDHHGVPAGQHPATGQSGRSAHGRAAQGPQAKGHARRHAGGLGRRVRPHGLQPGHPHQGQLRPRPSHPRNFTMWMAGGGVKPRPGLPRDGRLQLQHHRQAGPHPRSERDDPALPGNQPREADLQVPGPRLPPDGRGRQDREGHPGVGRGEKADKMVGSTAPTILSASRHRGRPDSARPLQFFPLLDGLGPVPFSSRDSERSAKQLSPVWQRGQ